MPIPDRQKQRREYLRKKGQAITLSGVCALLGGSAFLIALGTMLGLFFPDPDCGLDGYPPCSSIKHLNFSFSMTLASMVWMIVFALVGLVSVRGFLMQSRHVSTLPYIPPVNEWSLSLPAEEILVRSSQEPEQKQSTVLLRATENADTPAEELLRAATEASEKAMERG